VNANPKRIILMDSEIEARVASALESIEKLERCIDDADFIPATQQHRGQMILALFSKALTVGRAICALVRAGFGEEAFGMSRTLFDIYFDVRYISNKNTESRAEKFAMFFTKDIEGWRKIVPRYYPQITMPQTAETKEILQIAENYSNPHDWSGEPHKTSHWPKSRIPTNSIRQGNRQPRCLTMRCFTNLLRILSTPQYARWKATSPNAVIRSKFGHAGSRTAIEKRVSLSSMCSQ
jgi:hypothetical protein